MCKECTQRLLMLPQQPPAERPSARAELTQPPRRQRRGSCPVARWPGSACSCVRLVLRCHLCACIKWPASACSLLAAAACCMCERACSDAPGHRTSCRPASASSGSSPRPQAPRLAACATRCGPICEPSWPGTPDSACRAGQPRQGPAGPAGAGPGLLGACRQFRLLLSVQLTGLYGT